MKVVRRGYFVYNRCLHYKDVIIDWKDEEITDDLKALYIKEVKNGLGDLLTPYIDVSGSSNVRMAKFLSPRIVKSLNGLSVLQVSNKLSELMSVDADLPGIFEYVYLNALKPWQLDYILHIRCFFDIFQNPYKKENSAARACAVYQLLYQQNKLDYLNDLSTFSYWCWCNVYIMSAFDEEEAKAKYNRKRENSNV